MANLLNEAKLAREAIKKAEQKLIQIQNQCSHPKEVLDVVPHAHDGYAERTHYVNHIRCGVCGKFWIEDQ